MTLKDMMRIYQELISKPQTNKQRAIFESGKSKLYNAFFEIFQKYAIVPNKGEIAEDIDDYLPQFMDEAIDYFISIEEYEKCDYLHKYKVKYIINKPTK